MEYLTYATSLLVGVILGVLLNFPYKDAFFPTIPYKHVVIDKFEYKEAGFHLRATFEKTDCVFKKMETHGAIFGRWERLPYYDIDGEKGDRLKGWHTINIWIDAPAEHYDIVEVRTRHLCPIEGETEPEIVDRIFFRSISKD